MTEAQVRDLIRQELQAQAGVSRVLSNVIPIADVPTVIPGQYDHLLLEQNGAARKALAPEVNAAAAALGGALNGLVAQAKADIAPALANIGYLPPVVFAAGILVDSTRLTVERGGQIYAALKSAMPFTTTATFNPAQWRLLQGITGADLASSTGSGMVGFRGRTVLSRLSETISVQDGYGFSNLPGHDNRASIQAAINDAGASTRKGQREVIVRGNDMISVSGPIDVPDNIRLIFDGEARLVPSSDGFNVIRSMGALPVADFPLTADARRGGFSVAVGSSNAAAFAKGDYIWIKDSFVIDTSPNSNALTQAQMARVSAVEGGVLFLDRLLQYDYTVSNQARVGVMYCRKGIRLENIKIGAEGSPRAFRGLDLRWHDDLRVTDFDFSFNRRSYSVAPEFSDTNANGFTLKHCCNVVAERITGRNNAFYLVEIDGASHNVVVRDVDMKRGRHAVSLNWNGPGEPINVLVENLLSEVTQLGGFDTHDVGRDITARKIKCVQSLADGLQVRTSNVLIDDYVGEFNGANGLVVRADIITDQNKIKNVRLRNIEVRDNGLRGVLSQAPIDLDGFAAMRNGSANPVLNDSGGVVAPAGSIRNGRCIENFGAAFMYQPFNVDTEIFGAMLIEGVRAPAGARQTRFVYSSANFEGKGLQLRNVEAAGYTTANLFSRPNSTYIADIDEAGNRWGAGPKSGVVLLVGGASSITTDQVRSTNATATRVFRSKVTLRVLQNGGVTGSLAASINDGSGFSISSSSATDTSRVEWTVE